VERAGLACVSKTKTAFTWETSNAVCGLGANWSFAKHAAGVPAVIMLLPVETWARDPSYRLGRYVHISERLLRLYRFVPRSGLDNFTGCICLTGGCSRFASRSLKADACSWRSPVPSYLSFDGRGVACYSFLLCHRRYSQHYAKAIFCTFHKYGSWEGHNM